MESRRPDQQPVATSADNDKQDFSRLRQTGERGGASLAIGSAIGWARGHVARFLIRLGATPNRVSVAGMLLTGVAAYCLYRGAGHEVPYFRFGEGPVSWWPALAAVMLVLAGACDMLDGAVARAGGMSTRFGAVLDSSLDRFSDMLLYLGCMLYFGLNDNLTYQVLAFVALCNTVLISYIKARAEDLIENCTVGYWERGERFAALLIACSCGHVAGVLWQQALLPAFTVSRRLIYAKRAIDATEQGRSVPPRTPPAGLRGLLLPWRHPRGSVPYDVVTGTNIAYIIFGPLMFPFLFAVGPHADPLRIWVGS